MTVLFITYAMTAGEGGKGDRARPGAEASEKEGPGEAASPRWRSARVVRRQLMCTETAIALCGIV